MSIHFTGLPTDSVDTVRRTGRDSYGLPVERHRSDGDVWPCRHCLGDIPEGEDYLILAHRPFRQTHAYAETGPIFLCATDCAPATPSAVVPEILRSPSYLVRGYSAQERIVYGTGRVVATREIPAYAEQLLGDADIAFVDVRSAANNCYQCRIRRA